MDEEIILSAGEEDAGTRVDVFLADELDDLTRSHIQKLIGEGRLTVNGQPVKANYKVKAGDTLRLLVPPPIDLNVRPENIPLDIRYEDEDLVVVNKPRGMVVHPAAGNYSGTLVNALLYHCRNLSGINGVMRPGIVHRLDKDTSGLLVVAKNDKAHLSLANQIKNRTVNRRYIALVHGNITTERGTVDAPIGRHPVRRKEMAVIEGGRHAVTHFAVLERFAAYTLVEAKLETGRTHQIRVHMAYISHPVVGDPVYGPKSNPFGVDGQLLHAKILGFTHPRTGQYLEFSADIPEIFIQVLTALRQRVKNN